MRSAIDSYNYRMMHIEDAESYLVSKCDGNWFSESIKQDDIASFKSALIYNQSVISNLFYKEGEIYKGFFFTNVQYLIGYYNAIKIYDYLLNYNDDVFIGCIQLYIGAILGDNFELFKRITFDTDILDNNYLESLDTDYHIFDWANLSPHIKKFYIFLIHFNIPMDITKAIIKSGNLMR